MTSFHLSPLPMSQPQLGTPFKVAVTGHCHLDAATTEAFVTDACTTVLQELQQAHPEGLVALSGLAPGADTIFAEVALRLSLPLEACIAAANVLEKYAPGSEMDQHLRLRQASRRVHALPFIERSGSAYVALGHWLVHACDLLIAVWNGQPALKPGGTGDVVTYACSYGRPIIHIHTVEHTICPIEISV